MSPPQASPLCVSSEVSRGNHSFSFTLQTPRCSVSTFPATSCSGLIAFSTLPRPSSRSPMFQPKHSGTTQLLLGLTSTEQQWPRNSGCFKEGLRDGFGPNTRKTSKQHWTMSMACFRRWIDHSIHSAHKAKTAQGKSHILCF